MPPTRRHGQAWARVFCYALGPLSAAMALLGSHGRIWSVRFHAVHSILMATVWAGAWSALRAVERMLPWFLSVVTRELRFAMTLGFVAVWVFLLATAWGGGRCATIPVVHRLAVRLARRSLRA